MTFQGSYLPQSDTYLGFTLLQRRRDFLGEDMPSARLASWWIAGMLLATVVLSIFLADVVITAGPGFIESLGSSLTGNGS